MSFWLPPGSHKKIYQWQLHRKISRWSKCNVQYGKFQALVNQWWEKAVSKHHRTEQQLVCCLNTQIMIELAPSNVHIFPYVLCKLRKGRLFLAHISDLPTHNHIHSNYRQRESSCFTDSSQIIIDNCYRAEINVWSRLLLYFIKASEVPDTLI